MPGVDGKVMADVLEPEFAKAVEGGRGTRQSGTKGVAR
jgi:hypothetical protein